MKCPNEIGESLPIYIVDPIATKYENERIVSEFEQQTWELVDKFMEALTKTYKKLKEKGVPIEEVSDHIEAYYFVYKDRDIVRNNRLLPFLCNNITWFDFQLANDLIKEFLKDDQEITEVWAKYKFEFKEYAKDRIEKYKEMVFSLPAEKESVPMYLAIDPACKMKLSDISTLRRNICKILNIQSKNLYFYSIRTGSIILTFLLPRSTYKKLFPLSGDQLLDLIELDIIFLSIEEFHVFPDSEEWSFVLNNRPGKKVNIEIMLDCLKVANIGVLIYKKN